MISTIFFCTREEFLEGIRTLQFSRSFTSDCNPSLRRRWIYRSGGSIADVSRKSAWENKFHDRRTSHVSTHLDRAQCIYERPRLQSRPTGISSNDKIMELLAKVLIKIEEHVLLAICGGTELAIRILSAFTGPKSKFKGRFKRFASTWGAHILIYKVYQDLCGFVTRFFEKKAKKYY